MLSVLILIAVLAADQLVKWKCAEWLPTLEGGSYSVIDGVFALSYVENRGAAFGLLQNGQVFFIVITIVFCGAILYFMFKEYNRMHAMMRISLSLVLAGALGNFIDRAALGYVRDMFYVELINFPVFNVADSAICVGAGLLVLDVLFFKGKKYLDMLDEKTAKAGSAASGGKKDENGPRDGGDTP